MAERTKIELFPKTDWSAEQVAAVRKSHLAHGAKRCDQTEDAENRVLTTVWTVID